MPRARLLFLILASLATFALAGVGTASAAGTITFDGSPGTAAPPATLGPYAMKPFDLDPQPFGFVGSVTGPTGDVTFSPALYHVRVGQGWATWSHGYGGDVYATLGPLSATIALPSGTNAFYFYAEPNPFAVFSITAVAQDGTSSGPIAVDGLAGAQYFGFYSTGSEHIASITISSDADFAIGEFGKASRNYVALGDSYSSGEGNPPFIAGTDGPSDYCHRSSQAYSEVLGAQIGAAPRFYACSGAVTSDITSTFHSTEPPQLTQPGADSSADLVTMTIGGNDAGFADVLQACISQKLKADLFNAAIGPVARWLGFGKDPSCAHSSTFVSSVNTRVDNIFWPVKTTYLQVMSAVDPVNTSVIVADYPHLFPASHDAQNCLQLSPILTNADMDFMTTAGDRLDAVLQTAAGEAGVNFVDVRPAFAGHEICGAGGSYMNALSVASGNGGSCTWFAFGHCIIPGLPIVGSFHPNAAGHASGYAASFASYIDSAATKTRAGFPANPAALPDPPSVTAIPAVGVGPLTAHAVTSGSSDCSDTYQAGQQVQVSGDAFVPGTPVQLYVTSPGLGSSGELRVGAAIADALGHISGVVRVPLAATGFTQAGASAGMVFLDAIGLGSAAGHQDDLATVGLAPHTSPCGTVEPLPFVGFKPPIANPPQVNTVKPGRAIPVKFSIPGANGAFADVVAAGYPQSAPVSCTAPEPVTSGDPTVGKSSDEGNNNDNNESTGNNNNDDSSGYTYVWKTDRSWNGCRTLIVKLVDGTYHRAVFDFGR